MVCACLFAGAAVALLILPLCPCATAYDELQLQARLTPCELVAHFGYPCEISHANTDDGYVLEVDRIRHGRFCLDTCEDGRQHHYPVLLLPALLGAWDLWFLNYPSQSIGFLLADEGFDVWAMNFRESAPYAHHTTLEKDDGKFWKWSFDEIGRYDVAAGIDHVLDATGAPTLTLFGTSQGVTAALVLLSTRPEYNNKVELVVAYGPPANISNMGHPMPLLLETFQQLAADMDRENEGGYFNLKSLFTSACGPFCEAFCSWILTSYSFMSPYQLNVTRVPMYKGHYPIGTSFQNLHHYHQIYQAQDFVMYDHGAEENIVRYSQATPPPYALERIRSTFALFSSEEDYFASPQDVADLIARLPHQNVLHRVVSHPGLRHFDFSAGYRATDSLHKFAVDTVRRHASIRQ